MFKYYRNGKDTAYSLTEKSSPCHTCDSHVEKSHKNIVCQHIGSRRTCQKNKWCLRVAESRKNSRCNIIEEEEGKTADIDHQVQRRISHDFLRCMDHDKQPVAEQKSE